MNAVQVVHEDLHVNLTAEEFVAQLSDVELQQIAGGTAITNSI